MYKIFALFVLILAPIIVTIASQFTPVSDHAASQLPAPPSASAPEAAVHFAPAPAPTPPPQTMTAPADPAAAAIAGAPMIDHKGIDPVPQITADSSPASPPAPEDAPPSLDQSNDDRPDL